MRSSSSWGWAAPAEARRFVTLTSGCVLVSAFPASPLVCLLVVVCLCLPYVRVPPSPCPLAPDHPPRRPPRPSARPPPRRPPPRPPRRPPPCLSPCVLMCLLPPCFSPRVCSCASCPLPLSPRVCSCASCPLPLSPRDRVRLCRVPLAAVCASLFAGVCETSWARVEAQLRGSGGLGS